MVHGEHVPQAMLVLFPTRGSCISSQPFVAFTLLGFKAAPYSLLRLLMSEQKL